jgi:hypothetical protein
MKTPEYEAKWKTIMVDIVDTYSDLLIAMSSEGKPMPAVKKFASLFYDRLNLFFG